jgi:DNA-binding FadR family transcriptional regulator
VSKFLYDDISAQIENAIMKMSTGDKLPSERVLAAKYGVSRNVLREALRSLSEKGLLEIRPSKGIYVANLEKEKIAGRLETFLLKNPSCYRNNFIDIVEARTTLEMAVFEIASERATEDDFRSIDGILQKMENCKDDVEAFSNFDLQFHLRIAEATHNSVFPVLVKTLCDMTGKQMFMFNLLNPDKLDKVCHEHIEIVEAIKNKDKERIAKAGKHHFNLRDMIGAAVLAR